MLPSSYLARTDFPRLRLLRIVIQSILHATFSTDTDMSIKFNAIDSVSSDPTRKIFSVDAHGPGAEAFIRRRCMLSLTVSGVL